MSFDTALRLTARHYGAYPGPTQRTYELALGVADYFAANSVSEVGVIGVAIGSDGYHYLGLSPALQRAVMTHMQEGQSLSHGHFRLGRGLEGELGVKFDLCRKVGVDILEKSSFNKGCAEKKIVSNIYQRKLKITEISVVAYPISLESQGLEAHVVVASSEATDIAPCRSCLAIYTG